MVIGIIISAVYNIAYTVSCIKNKKISAAVGSAIISILLLCLAVPVLFAN